MEPTTPTGREVRQELYALIRSDEPFEYKAREALALGERYLDADNGHLTRIDRETDHWEAIVSTDSADGRFPPGLELDLGTTYCRRTLAAEGPITLSDASAQGWAADPAFEAHEIHCYHGTTLFVDGDVYGTICFVAEEPRHDRFSEDETMFAELITRLLERELERDRHTAELTKQANLATVLNRVLRHNIRNDITVVRGYTQELARNYDESDFADIAVDSIDALIDLSEKARELDRIVAGDFERTSVVIEEVVGQTVEEVTDAFPSLTATLESDADITAPVLPSFDRALEELLENAAKHSGDDPHVSVTVTTVPNAVEIHVADNGPGIAPHEAEVLEKGTETPLVHGSGLGLWIAHWIVTSHDGSIEATVTEDGTRMSISLPRTPTPDVRRQLTRLTRARDQYQAAFDEASDAMVLVNDDGRIVDANQTATRIYGLTRRELLGRRIRTFLPSEFDFESAWSAFQQRGRDRDTVTITGADETEIEVEYSATTDVVPGIHLVSSRAVREL